MASSEREEVPSPDWPEIIAQLRLEAGRIMEDTSDDLAMRLSTKSAAAEALLRKEREAADDIQSLLAAAQVLHRRCVRRDQD